MKLIGSITSPYVRKTRIALAEKKIDVEFVLEDVWSPQSQIEQTSPLAKVPVLVLDDGFCVYDSRVIVEYLDSLAPTHRLIPEGGRERTEVKIWECLADGLMDAAVLMLLESKRPEQERSHAWIERQSRKVQQALKTMSMGLGQQTWCHGKSFSLADIATGAALGYLDLRFSTNPWRTEFPNLKELFDRLSQRPSFIATEPK